MARLQLEPPGRVAADDGPLGPLLDPLAELRLDRCFVRQLRRLDDAGVLAPGEQRGEALPRIREVLAGRLAVELDKVERGEGKLVELGCEDG
ncbi:MAG TPA: hypothetical protein VD866_00890 [Urbifossiella sp.]|nr:hypothetical protein [Urbifossiella sp.]